MEPVTYQQTFTIDDHAHLRVENIRGSVVIQAGNTGQITVTAVIDPASGHYDQTRVEITQPDDQSVLARTQIEQNVLGTMRPCKVDYTIQAPLDCDLDVRCVSSSLVVEGLHGQFGLKTVSGSQTLNQLSGSFELHTVSGNIIGLNLQGILQLKTVSGDVRLGESEIHSLRASSVSGQISLETPLSDGPYHFNSVSGDVRLLVPPETGCEIMMKTFSGDLRLGLPASHHRHTAKARQATVQGGGTQIFMHSMSGNLQLHSPDIAGQKAIQPRDTTAPDVASPVDQPADRMAILDKIASGELSVDEGIRLFEGAQTG